LRNHNEKDQSGAEETIKKVARGPLSDWLRQTIGKEEQTEAKNVTT